MSEASSDPASEKDPSPSPTPEPRRKIPPVVHGLAFFFVFLGFLIYPFTGSRGTNILAGLLLLTYLGARNVLHGPLRRLQDWLTPREQVKNLLLASLAMVFFAGSIEAVGQLVTRSGWVEPYSAIKTQLPQGVADFRQFHITSDKFRVSDPVLLWRPVDQWPYNEQRMKGPVAEMPKPPGLLRILSYGDSNTDGPNEGAWSERLQGVLASAASGDANVQVINAGVAGYTSHQGLQRFRQTVDDFDPDLIFVSYGWNDAAPAVNGADREYQPPPRWLTTAERFLLHFESFRALKTLQVPEADEKPRDVDFPPRVSLADYRENLTAFLEEARARSIEPVFLTRPYSLPRQTMEAAPKDMRRRVPSYNDEIRAFAQETGAHIIDVQQRFAIETHPDIRSLFTDDCHFNGEGSQIMAEFLYRHLVELDLLPPTFVAAEPSPLEPEATVPNTTEPSTGSEAG